MCREARNNEWDIFITESGTWCYIYIYVDTVEYDTFLERNKNGNK